MPPLHLSGTSRALYRVFIAPSLSPALRIAANKSPRTLTPSSLSLLPQTWIRPKVFKRDTQRHALSDTYTLDTAINSPTVNLVDLQGRFHAQVSLNDTLNSLDRSLYHILQVSPGKVDEFGRPGRSNPPTCKVISKMDLRQQHKLKLDIARKQARGISSGPALKNLELNWAIDENDLRHRLKKMTGFLKEGRKVEVLLGPKRRGRVATTTECQALLAKVRDAVAECKGAKESKEPDGKIGGVVTLVFEGKKVEKKVDENSDAPI
ncbi:hypothetical protein BCR34DRAFT_219602 [Clohesyomyces aquaticus]|uniref:Translation initiation factor IF-3, C-terminal domain-domain-containing protein n=1 Tax=Clohesyomyces aquaticus TaxID=1231657 RepID=A0A1Y1Y9M6_9PLEO|nr:hypothetical protein BCR34DRAFT_219602 [Clohesyomyces aquaticus]